MPSIKQASSVGSTTRSSVPSTPKNRKLKSESETPPTSTPKKRRLRSEPETPPSLEHRKLSRQSSEEEISEAVNNKRESCDKLKWDPRDEEQISAVKVALHVSTAPSTIVCREDEQNRILDFCKKCIKQEQAGGLYVCGVPGTGKSLSVEKVQRDLLDWTSSECMDTPDILMMNCNSLKNTSEIFIKIMSKHQSAKKISGSKSPLQQLQHLYSHQHQSRGLKMMLIIADELDKLITRDRSGLHDLFMLTTFPYAKCILIGIANAIDLADRFLPKLQSMNCKPMVICFKAYSNDQILKILQERLSDLPYTIFHQQALELCSKKVASASGDMRRALSVCRSAIEILEAEVKNAEFDSNLSIEETELSQQVTEKGHIVRIDHIAIALSKAYKSTIVDTIHSLPQHSQIILCCMLKLFCSRKKETTVTELSRYYVETCQSIKIPPLTISDFINNCGLLNDCALLKLDQARNDKLKRVTLKADEADISFALQGIRLFRNCLQ